jgi:uncharacterized protein YbjT (DUF2867 family)
MEDPEANPILLTGATGYVGGRLLRALEAEGRRVRCLARRPKALEGHIAGTTDVVEGDVLDAAGLREALSGVGAAYYMVHSMAGGSDFEERDREAARNFGDAARESGVERIIYLGGLARGEELSSHLASRIEVGRILRESGVKTVELRASIVIGAGSLSFEVIRSLVERLPVMVTPRWVSNRAQPIAISDLIGYLLECLTIDLAGHSTFEIGGADVASYKDIMDEYARQRGVRRAMIPVPVLTPWLSSLWLALVTPVFARVGRRLIEGVKNESFVTDTAALDVFSVRPVGLAEAIAEALEEPRAVGV